jgi:hypothetical protein
MLTRHHSDSADSLPSLRQPRTGPAVNHHLRDEAEGGELMQLRSSSGFSDSESRALWRELSLESQSNK